MKLFQRILLVLFVVALAEGNISFKYDSGSFVCILSGNAGDSCEIKNINSYSEMADFLSDLPNLRRSGRLPTGGFSFSNENWYGSPIKKVSCKNVNSDRLPPQLFKKLEIEEFAAVAIQLESISSEDFKFAKGIKKLNLSDNKIDQLGSLVFTHLKNLIIVDLSHNQISIIHERAFAEMSGTLFDINLSHNKIAVFMEKHFQLLGANQKYFLQINLENNKIGDIKREPTPSSKFEKYSAIVKIDTLNLNNNNVTSFESSQLEIRKLFINNNRLEKLSVDSILHLEAGNNKFKHFHIDETMVNVSLKNNEISSLKCGKNLKIERLNLSENEIASGSIGELKLVKSLKALDLSNNSLGAIYADTFSGMESLEKLNLRNAKVKGFSRAFSSASVHRKLNVLDISENKISSLPDFESFRKLFPSLLLISLEENNWKCDYLSMLAKFLATRRIKILEPSKRVEGDSTVNGIKCLRYSLTSTSRPSRPSTSRPLISRRPITRPPTLRPSTLSPSTLSSSTFSTTINNTKIDNEPAESESSDKLFDEVKVQSLKSQTSLDEIVLMVQNLTIRVNDLESDKREMQGRIESLHKDVQNCNSSRTYARKSSNRKDYQNSIFYNK